MSGSVFSMQVGFDTDIGGGKENQDDFLVFSKPALNVFVGGVFDGHGREVGKIAANAARASLLKFCEENIEELIADPVKSLIKAHEVSHSFIKQSFRLELEGQGFEIQEDEKGGYLMKRKLASNQSWGCVHGGSSSTIVAIIGTNMYIANVGDSSAILSSTSPALTHTCINHIVDSAISVTSPLVQMRGSMHSQYMTNHDAAPVASDTLVVTAEHSPESPYEFYRLREFRARDEDSAQPALLVVYDSPSHEKARCNPVFQLNGQGQAEVTNAGKYYKNVRKEWASLVSTPTKARFQDALAFTRSLGDLHLSSYGVTHLPEVHQVDLASIFALQSQHVAAAAAAASTSGDATSSSSPLPVLCLVIATDGVWDNWLYEDVTKFVLDASCLGAIKSDANGGKRVAQSLMNRNGVYAKRNFGAQADNATGIVLYITQDGVIPNGPDFRV